MSSEATFAMLGQYLQMSRRSERTKPAFWLGAGCSVHDGVPLNDALLASVVPDTPGAWGSAQYRFDRYCDSVAVGPTRRVLFEPYFQRTISADSPYHAFARILLAEYADLVFTFNIDDLLEQALQSAGCREGIDYRVYRVPEYRPDVVRDLILDNQPRIRIVKLHGDYRAGHNYMTSREIISYETSIAELVQEFSKRGAVVCGYSFFHLNVLTSFSLDGGSLFYVNRSFPSAPMVLSLMASRSHDQFIDGTLGQFEVFTDRLARELGV